MDESYRTNGCYWRATDLGSTTAEVSAEACEWDLLLSSRAPSPKPTGTPRAARLPRRGLKAEAWISVPGDDLLSVRCAAHDGDVLSDDELSA